MPLQVEFHVYDVRKPVRELFSELCACFDTTLTLHSIMLLSLHQPLLIVNPKWQLRNRKLFQEMIIESRSTFSSSMRSFMSVPSHEACTIGFGGLNWSVTPFLNLQL